MQRHIKIENKEDMGYFGRTIMSALTMLTVFALLLLFGDYRFHIGALANAILVILFFAILLFVSDDPLRTRYYLLCVEINNDNVIISFRNKTKLCVIHGKRSEFKAAKVSRWGLYGSYKRLEITHNGALILKQHESGGISETKMNEIMSYLG